MNHKLLLASVVLVVSAMCLEGILGGTDMSLTANRQGTTSDTFDISLSFTAMDENGTAISGATVYCSDSSGGVYSQAGTTDSQGKYSSSNFLVSTISPAECPNKEVTRYCYAQKGDIKTNTVSGTAELTCYVAPTATVTSTATPAPSATPTPTASAISPTSTPASYGIGNCVNLLGTIRKIIRIQSGDIYIYNTWRGTTGWTGTEDGSFWSIDTQPSIVSCPASTPTATPTSTPTETSTATPTPASTSCTVSKHQEYTQTGDAACAALGGTCLSSTCTGGCSVAPDYYDEDCTAQCSLPTCA